MFINEWDDDVIAPRMMSYYVETYANPVFLNPVKPHYNTAGAV